MGEVYRAHDTKLARDVALKVLPDDVAGDPERLRRFEREARTLAALNHPHIAQVYGFEDDGTVRALVMELVPGESLAARLARGPLPVRDAFELARQIADGLEAAHDKAIVHRDLKPANVQVTPDGQVKILDFGLAKALDAGSRDSASLRETEISPTLTAQTHHGVILGTAAYMSPEQARGLPVDARTDVWAFGCVLYEMLTARRAFAGATATDVLAAVLERDPDWAALPAGLPPTIRSLLQRCLKKDPRQRLHHIADARFALEDALAGPSSGEVAAAGGLGTAAPQLARALWRHPLPLGLALVALCLGGALAWSVSRTPATPPKEPAYLSLVLPPDQSFTNTPCAISPDGRDLVYVAVADEGPPGPEGDEPRLYHRRLTEPSGRALPGTERAIAPFFSPDGAWVGFSSQVELARKKIALGGGGPVVLEEGARWTSGSGPGWWTDTGDILFGKANGPIERLPAAGGAADTFVPRTAIQPDETGMVWPFSVKGGLVYEAALMKPSGRIVASVGGQRRVLVTDGKQPGLLGPQHLVFWRNPSPTQVDVLAARFDRERAELIGEPASVLSVEGAPSITYCTSATGTFAYRANTGGSGRSFAWLARDTAPRPALPPSLLAGVQGVFTLRLSPDGRGLLYFVVTSRERRLMIADTQTGTARIVSSGGPHFWSVWSHDGRRVIYQDAIGKEGAIALVWKPADGSGQAEPLTRTRGWQQPQAVTRDGRYLVYQETGGLGAAKPQDQTYDLWLLPLTPRGEPRPLLRTKASERLPALSPDDRWMAYVSDETGQDEVWVRAFPEGESAVRVTESGGTEPVWAADGRTLYYRDSAGSRLYAVPVTMGTVPQFGPPLVTRGNWTAGFDYGRMYDVAPDGSVLLLSVPRLGRELQVVLNFDEVIRLKMAVGGK
jgi:Tol biopolymer transport system component